MRDGIYRSNVFRSLHTGIPVIENAARHDGLFHSYPSLLPSRAHFPITPNTSSSLLGLPPLYPGRQTSVISPVDLSSIKRVILCTTHHQCVGPCVVALLCRSNRLGDNDDDDAKWLSLVSLTVLLLWPRLVLTLRISPITGLHTVLPSFAFLFPS